MTMPVWDLPGIVKHFGIAEAQLRRALFEQTGGMLPELVIRSDLERFLALIGGVTAYILGELAALAKLAAGIANLNKAVAVRLHD
ncbi:MAG: hypothetical protein V7K17_22405 [Nostoc sp.]